MAATVHAHIHEESSPLAEGQVRPLVSYFEDQVQAPRRDLPRR